MLAQSLFDSRPRYTRHDSAPNEYAASVLCHWSVNYQNGCSVYLCYPLPPTRLVICFFYLFFHIALCTYFLKKSSDEISQFFFCVCSWLYIVCIWLSFAMVFRLVDGECGVISYGYWGRHDACHRSAVCVSNFMGREFDDCARLSFHLVFTYCYCNLCVKRYSTYVLIFVDV